MPHWCWAQNIVSYLESDTKINYAARRSQGTVHGHHCPAKVGWSILYGVLFLVAHPFQMANFRVSAQALPKVHSWQLSQVHWPIVDGWLSHTAGPSVMDPFDCPNWIYQGYHSASGRLQQRWAYYPTFHLLWLMIQSHSDSHRQSRERASLSTIYHPIIWASDISLDICHRHLDSPLPCTLATYITPLMLNVPLVVQTSHWMPTCRTGPW